MSNEQSRRQFLKTAGATSAAAAAGLSAPSIGRAATPFFKLYFLIPNNQPARMAWGTLAANQMTKLGVEVVSSYVPFSAIRPRRNTGDGATHVQGGWDAYLERYYYNSITPVPNNLFRSTALPPNGQMTIPASKWRDAYGYTADLHRRPGVHCGVHRPDRTL